MTTLHWGILGAAQIAENRMIPAIKAAKNNTLTAIGSRDLGRAQRLAALGDGAHAYDSYEAVLADKDVNAVYIPLPNAMHAEWAIKAAEAGKHVLVEKTFAANAEEAENVIDACSKAGVTVSESLMYRFHPLTRRILDITRSGMLGKIRSINTTFSFTLEDPHDIRRNQALAGGALNDLGTYCVHFARAIAADEPIEVMARGTFGPSGTDETITGLMRFPNDLTATFTSSFDMPRVSPLIVVGTRGMMYVPHLFTYFSDNIIRMTLDDKQHRVNTSESIEHIGNTDPYILVLEDFAEAIATKRAPKISPDSILRHQRVLDALISSARGDCV